jgi:toxin HigB-1
MIGGFRHKGLEEIYLTGKTRRIGADHIRKCVRILQFRKCVRILQLLEVAEQPEDMNIAGFRFHGLQGNPKRWSVRVTGNYRITFGWSGEDALEVDFEDYH